MDHIAPQIFENGYSVLDGVLPPQQIFHLEHELYGVNAFDFKHSYANLLHCSSVTEAASCPVLMQLIKSVSTKELFPVRAIILDKTQEMNWRLSWHQDLKIAVRQKIDIDGYTNWSLEAGIWHVQPPANVLETLLSLRIHFDTCTADNGAIRVIPRSHTQGIFSREQIEDVLKNMEPKTVSMNANSLMVMRPLLLHDSPPSFSTARRRVLQIEYGFALNNGLEWR